jgi:hypothetical protein
VKLQRVHLQNDPRHSIETKSGDARASIKPSSPWQRLAAFATVITSSQLPNSHVWFAGVGLPMPIVCDLESPALGRKVSDEFTIPLCRGHHREVHRCGDEAAWWMKIGIDPTATARVLWLKSRPLPSTSSGAATKIQNKANLETCSP